MEKRDNDHNHKKQLPKQLSKFDHLPSSEKTMIKHLRGSGVKHSRAMDTLEGLCGHVISVKSYYSVHAAPDPMVNQVQSFILSLIANNYFFAIQLSDVDETDVITNQNAMDYLADSERNTPQKQMRSAIWLNQWQRNILRKARTIFMDSTHKISNFCYSFTNMTVFSPSKQIVNVVQAFLSNEDTHSFLWLLRHLEEIVGEVDTALPFSADGRAPRLDLLSSLRLT
jgi:hypothetical protein